MRGLRSDLQHEGEVDVSEHTPKTIWAANQRTADLDVLMRGGRWWAHEPLPPIELSGPEPLPVELECRTVVFKAERRPGEPSTRFTVFGRWDGDNEDWEEVGRIN